jgi:hypothetical protein
MSTVEVVLLNRNTTTGRVTAFGVPNAKQISAGRNANGIGRDLYVGTNNDLYHNREVGPNSDNWTGETHFPNASAKQVVVAQNKSRTRVVHWRSSTSAPTPQLADRSEQHSMGRGDQLRGRQRH